MRTQVRISNKNDADIQAQPDSDKIPGVNYQ